MIKLTALLSVIVFTSFSVITQTEYCVYEADFRLLFESDQRIVGYVEYCFNHTWRGVCRESWGVWEVEEAVVACRQLGYSDQQQDVTAGANCNRPTSQFVTLNCTNGTESNLQECGVMAVDNCSCPTGGYFNVYSRLLCVKTCTDNETRLVGGSTDREGRVEVCLDGRWGTVQTNQPRKMADLVCHNHFDSLTLDLYSISSCLVSQFGYSTSKPVYSCSLVENDGDSTLSCTNTSSNNHSMDLGVLCQPPPDPAQEGAPCRDDGTFRLTNGMSNREGRVEVCVDGRWGTVCNNSQEGIAGAVCSQLGFPAQGATTTTSIANDWARSYSCVVGGSEAGVNCMKTCCDNPASLAVKCLTHQEVEDPSSPPPSTSLTTPHSHNQSSNCSACTVSESVAVTSLSAVSAALVAATLISWTVTGGVVCRRGSTAATKQSPKGPSLQRNESYCLTQPVEQVYDDATSTKFNYSSLVPNYDTIASSSEGGLDTIMDHNRQNTNTPQDKTASPTPVRDEASKKSENFYDVEEHTYAAVSVQRKKEARSEPDEGGETET